MELYGIYCKTIYRDDYTSYTSFMLEFYHPVRDLGDIKKIECRGNIPLTHIFMPLKLQGEITTGKNGQLIFVVESADLYVSEKHVAADFLLNSGKFVGMTEDYARKFLRASGSDIFEFVTKTDAEELLESEGIPTNKAHNWTLVIVRYKRLQDLIRYFSEYNVSYAKIEKLFKLYGDKSVEMVKENPYKVGYKIDLKFSICDAIGKSNGYKFDDPERLKYLIFCTFQKVLSQGDMWVECSELLKHINYNNRAYSSFPTDTIPFTTLVCMLEDLDFVVINYQGDQINCYFKGGYLDEMSIAKNIKRLNRCPEKYDSNIEHKIERIERNIGIKYSDKQKKCFYLICTSGVKVITGGPGTGKSTTIDGIIHLYGEMFPFNTITMMAPTGRAAKRITEITGRPAGTIHRTLNIKPYEERCESSYHQDFPSELIIVDESSMIDSALMSILLKAVRTNSTVIFVGDTDQLPSVGCGNVLYEMIKNEHIDNVRLDVNHRQDEKSTIVSNAIKIRNGNSNIDGTKSDFKIYECDTDEEMHNIAVKCFQNCYDKNNPDSCQLLTPVKKSDVGTRKLNKELQEWVNSGERLAFGYGVEYRMGDKVMTIRNNYESDYFNGDVGTVTGSSDEGIEIDTDGKKVFINRSDLQDLTLAYATTVHKSQGSEFTTAIIVLPEEPAVMLRRNLFYTAVTRAKKNVILITKKGCIDKAVNNKFDRIRTSSLSDKINEAMEA